MIHRNIHKIISSLALGLVCALPASAWLPDYNNASAYTLSPTLQRSREMTAASNFPAAIDALISIATEDIPLTPDEEQEFIFLLGNAYFSTGDQRCIEILREYAADYPASADASTAILLTGDFYFFAADWSRALEEYKRVDLNLLTSDKRNLYSYREGVCMLRRGFYKEARPLFLSLEKSKDYALLADYYLGYLDYVGDDTHSAVERFENVAKIQNNEDLRLRKILLGERLYPEFYLAQCYFRLGEWEKCAKMAQGILKRDNLPEEQMKLETMRVYGLSEYETGEYLRAEGLLDSYVGAMGENATDDARYALGVCEYEAGRYESAAKRFAPLLGNHDILAQGSYLYLGQIEALSGNPSGAAIDFEKAYRMSYDPKVAEAALYNYVAASSQGGNIPFDNNVEMLERFIESYPQSQYTPAVERHLAWMYYQQGDYEKAVGAIDRLRRPSADDLHLKQKIYYAAGASSLSQGKARKAAELLKQCVAIKSNDPKLTAQAYIWLGDAEYRSGNYRSAESAYEAALKSGYAGENEDILRYDLGYTKYQLGKYADASRYFRPISGSLTALTPEMRRDAAVRIADCKYYTGDYASAKNDYRQLKGEGTGADYASYRYARILGREGDLSGKIAELERFEREFGGSPLISEVMSDLADAYSSTGNPMKAAEAYSRIVDRNPSDPRASEAMLGMAQAYFDAGKKEKGVDVLSKLLKSRPYSDEARLADKELRRYYADTHQLPEYAEFLKGIPGFSLGEKDMAALMFETAQSEYLENPSNISGIKEYLEKYPSGDNAGEAWLHLADYYYEADDRQNASAAYLNVERYGGPENRMAAFTGIMRTTDNAATRSEYARKILAEGGASAEARDEAEYYVAADRLKSPSGNEKSVARATLERLAANPFSAAGARSAVTLAQNLLDSGDAAKAANMMESFTSSGSEEQYWVARGFIVLADAYTAQGKDYLAQEYLKVLEENYPGDEADIKKMINSRLKR